MMFMLYTITSAQVPYHFVREVSGKIERRQVSTVVSKQDVSVKSEPLPSVTFSDYLDRRNSLTPVALFMDNQEQLRPDLQSSGTAVVNASNAVLTVTLFLKNGIIKEHYRGGALDLIEYDERSGSVTFTSSFRHYLPFKIEKLLIDLLERMVPSDKEFSELMREIAGEKPLKIHPDFKLLVTQNPSHKAGRKPLSPALRNRFHTYYVQDYTRTEYLQIANRLHVPDAEAFIDDCLKQTALYPEMYNSSDIFTCLKEKRQDKAAVHKTKNLG